MRGYGPQGFSLEVNPWLTNELVEAAHLYRGAIIGGWGSVESSLIELSIRASHHPAYLGHREFYPKKFSSRIKFLNEIFDLPGPLTPYSRFGHAVVRRFVEAEDLRNMMAHARLALLPGWGATFHFFEPKSGSEIAYRTQRFTEAQLSAHASKATRFSRAVRCFMARVDRLQLLPPLSAAECPTATPTQTAGT
jgi:hypothetical protein